MENAKLAQLKNRLFHQKFALDDILRKGTSKTGGFIDKVLIPLSWDVNDPKQKRKLKNFISEMREIADEKRRVATIRATLKVIEGERDAKMNSNTYIKYGGTYEQK